MISELRQTYMTAVVENTILPNQFLTKTLFPRKLAVTTETIRIESKTSGGREMAPFIRKNGEALMVKGYIRGGFTVEAPNIRIKRPLTPSEELFNRQVGGVLFSPTEASKYADFRQILADDLATMEEHIVNTEEWMCAMALQGSMAYSEADEEVFSITYDRDAANNVTLDTFWNDGTPANVRIFKDIIDIKRILSDEGEAAPTDVILGSEATDSVLELIEATDIKVLGIEGSNISAGDATLVSNFTDDGVLYIGKLGGLNFWSYTRTATLRGTTINMIRPKYAEFISRSSASDRILYYAAIPDVDALKGRNFVGRRFSKSWTQPDPSALMALVHSRPLPVPRRPNATVSVKVVSG